MATSRASPKSAVPRVATTAATSATDAAKPVGPARAETC